MMREMQTTDNRKILCTANPFLLKTTLALLSTMKDQTLEDEDFSMASVDTEVERRKLSVPISMHGQRLDRFLADSIYEFSRSYLQHLMSLGYVKLQSDKPILKASYRVKAGEEYQIELFPTDESNAFVPQPIPIDIVFEDESIWVIHKPAGLVVHPAPGNWSGTLLNGLLALDSRALSVPRAGIVHRLDKDTSGLMVVARTRQAMDALVDMIAQREIKREYLAIGHRSWSGPQVREIQLPIGRDPKNRIRMAVVDLSKNSGKEAHTTLSCLDTQAEGCLVHCQLHTGRTHQIRVHMAAIGHPLLGDVIYGGKPLEGIGGQALHAFRLSFSHPFTHKYLSFKLDLPTDIQNGLRLWGLSYN
jgi:23S rRNA pseudouridine1911/1915/1917 synthase